MAKLATKAQKTNKKSSKLKFANVTGRKKVMLITLFAFVAIGAGVIIRSFASQIIVDFPAAQLVPVTSAGFTPPVKNISNDSKSSVISWYVNPTPSTSQVFSPNFDVPPNSQYQICYEVRGIGKFYTSTKSGTLNASNNSDYQTYCTWPENTGNYTLTTRANFMIDRGNPALTVRRIYAQLSGGSNPSTPTK